MIVIEKNEGPKIDYEIQNTATKKKITFDDDLTINLAKREEDWAVLPARRKKIRLFRSRWIWTP